jgi:hypothetical protein
MQYQQRFDTNTYSDAGLDPNFVRNRPFAADIDMDPTLYFDADPWYLN